MVTRKFYLKLLMSLLLTATAVPLAQAQTASSSYLELNATNVAGIGTVPSNNYHLSNYYVYTESESTGSAWLNMSVYGAYYASANSNNTWITTSSPNQADASDSYWTTTSPFLGRPSFFSSNSSYGYGASSGTTMRTINFYVTNCQEVHMSGRTGTKASSNGGAYFYVYECNSDLSEGAQVKSESFNTNSSKFTFSATGLDATKVYKVVGQVKTAYFLEIAFKMPMRLDFIINPTNGGTLDFGEVSTTGSKTLNITIENNSGSGVTPTLGSLSAPFSTSYVASEIADGETATIPVRFAPTDGITYNGTFTITLNGVDYTINMTGSGRVNGPTMTDDDFAALTYDWTDSNNVLHEGTPMNEVATSAEQMIALMKAVYTNPNVPGNIYRGYTATGEKETDLVSYPAIGTVSDFAYSDSYGWNIPNVNDLYGSGYSQYLNPTDYLPNKEGLTVLLVEMNDKEVAEAKATEYGLPTTISGESTYQSTSSYSDLVKKFDVMFKSVRVLTSSKRIGAGETGGTLFKIDCDKMNRFFLLGKGRLRTYYSDNVKMTDENGNSYQVMTSDDVNKGPFYQMFEEFSPNVASAGTSAETDIYQKLVNMENYSVLHDCVSVPTIDGHHEFNLYGVASTSDDCQDVRDMMFFIPERRMTQWSDNSLSAGENKRDKSEDDRYVNYYINNAPKLGLFVIKQYPIDGEQVDGQNTYRLHLTWTSNLLDFLPGEDGQYTLYRVITNADGTKTYTPVVENLDPNTFEYDDYVNMQQNGQQVTYVVRGQDKEQFLTLQMSNEESFIIPGLNHAEQLQLRLTNEGFYSRFDPQTHSNYYSNRLTIENTVGTNVKASYLKNGSVLQLYRIPNLAIYSAQLDQQVDAGTITSAERETMRTQYILDNRINFANATVSNMNTTGSGTGTLTIAPVTTVVNYWDGTVYRENGEYVASPTTGSFTYDHTANSVVFDNFVVHDNMCVDVTGNTHPDSYSYYLTLETAEPFALGNAPVIATEQNGKIYAYFEKQYSDWKNVRAYAWRGVEGQEGFIKFAGDWAGTLMTPVKDENNQETNVYVWSIDERPDGLLPEKIIFTLNDSYDNWYEMGQVDFVNGGYYNSELKQNEYGNYYVSSSFVGVAATSNHAYSNLVDVNTHKTKMTAGAYDWTAVDGDKTHDLKIANEFDITVKKSSKSEILGYYAYRWDSSYGTDENPYAILDNDGNDISPNGQAGNQDQFYTVAMNTDYTANAIFQGRTVMDVPFIDNYITEHANEWTYVPVVEVFAPVGAVDANGNDREDYNTYGASLQKLASAKIEVTPSFTATTGTGQDGYEWTMNGSTYVYYNNLLQVNVLDLPQGYQVDKVRAWRKVNATDFLGEQAPNLPNTPDYRHRAVLDKNGEYMFSNYNTSNYDPESRYDIQKDGFIGGEEDANHIMAGTFGGKKLNQGETVTVDFVVRVYFTKTGTGAKDGENKTYYIAETTATGVLNSDIQTSIFGVESVKEVARIKYYNMAGIESDVPFQGVNIEVTTYTDGSRTTRKIMK